MPPSRADRRARRAWAIHERTQRSGVRRRQRGWSVMRRSILTGDLHRHRAPVSSVVLAAVRRSPASSSCQHVRSAGSCHSRHGVRLRRRWRSEVVGYRSHTPMRLGHPRYRSPVLPKPMYRVPRTAVCAWPSTPQPQPPGRMGGLVTHERPWSWEWLWERGRWRPSPLNSLPRKGLSQDRHRCRAWP